MEFAGDVLIVAGQYDGVANRLQQDLENRGRRIERLDGMSAARLFTIRVRTDSTSVSPLVPMFVRASAWWHDGTSDDSDQRFLRAEAFATFWAAAALSAAPVINSPGRDGPIGRLTWGDLASASSLDLASCGSEIYASGPEILDTTDESVWGEDCNFLTAPLSQLRRGSPVRMRKLNPQALYEIVIVVGDRAFPATTDPRSVDLNLASRSLALTHRVGVNFASVTWAVDDGGAKPIRLNAAPEEQELRYAWNDVASALCEDLLR